MFTVIERLLLLAHQSSFNLSISVLNDNLLRCVRNHVNRRRSAGYTKGQMDSTLVIVRNEVLTCIANGG